MMNVIGARRVLILIILFAVNAALVSAVYLYLFPETEKLDRQLRSLKGEISAKRNETDQLRTDFAQIQEKKVYFENLETAGFLSDQNRLVARRRIMDVQRYSKVLTASYDIQSARINKVRSTDNIGYVVLSSPISVDIEALDDVDLYSFVYWIQNAFPGHVAVNAISVERSADIGEASLREIGSGTPMTLVKGRLDISWRTILPESDVTSIGENASGEGF